jgi:hypothetical protein
MFKGLHGLTIKGHEINKKATDIFRQAMFSELKDRADISESLIPDWPVHFDSQLSSNIHELTRICSNKLHVDGSIQRLGVSTLCILLSNSSNSLIITDLTALK